MKKITLIVTTIVLCTTAFANTTTPPAPSEPLSEITKLHLSGLPTPLKKTTSTPSALSRYEKISTAYTILTPHLKTKHEQIANQNVWKDLEFLVGDHAKEINLLALFFNKTHLPEGEIYLVDLLTNPITNIQELRNRQAIITTLTNNPHLMHSFDATFLTLKNQHQLLCSLWASESQQLFNSHYFQRPFLKPLNTNSTYQGITPYLRTLPLLTASSSFVAFINYAYKNPTTLNEQTINAGVSLFFGIFALIGQLKNDLFALNRIHETANSVAALINAMDTLEKCIDENPALKNLQYANVFKDFAKTKTSLSPKMQRLTSLLRTNTFKGKPKLLSLKGRAKIAYALIQEIKEELIPALLALGEVDAYLSCAKLYKEFKGKNNSFVFAEYLEQNSPFLAVESLWNPFVGSEKSISNDIKLGNNLPLNIILTGPNAGGKSTFAKGIALNILLAQTITIVPAHSCILTPFSKINTYMNISDDTAGGNSLFKSEVLRAHELIHSIESLQKTNFSFSVMDEMFSGTSPKEGEAASYAVAENLGKKKNSILLLATHFPKLKKLETATGSFKNYQVRVVHNIDGTFIYPFKLQEGAADQNVAIDILKQQGFSSSILDRAQEILAEN